MTQTSTFGTSKREAHDASSFYNRNLYGGFFASEISREVINTIQTAELGDWADKIYHQSATDLSILPDNSVALAFTSPPYNVGKEYDNDINFEAYLSLIREVGKEVYRVLRPGGRYIINIANLGRKPYIPLHSFFYSLHTAELGFLPMGEIIWQKGRGASNSCAWGSWQSARAPRLRDIHEYLLVFAKQCFSRPDKGESTIGKEEFLAGTLSIWEIPPESARRVKHPAPFPEKLAQRVIELFSYTKDVVLDPFAGSGTTCVVAKKYGRHYVGFDISEEYCNLAKERIVKSEESLFY